ncbi:hypothetical protein [Sphingobacterium sp. UBA5670]|uniref:hypothetical protein n=1 Tax=Sphingobacterium sp. UBA5670 TaxID=1947502 RepID=UPI0025E591F7|nr:hypothetical protein [Sphingobacterium sp. UBA5670]
MLQNISWGQYLSILILLVLIYYVWYFIKYYQDGIIKRLSKDKSDDDIEVYNPFPEEKPSEDLEIELLENMVNEIREFILDKAGKQVDKNELAQQLESYVANFNGLHKPAFRYALTNYIIQQAEIKCGVVFEERELEAMWDKLSR